MDILESCFLAICAECEHQLDSLQRETAHFIWQFSHVLHTNCHGWGRTNCSVQLRITLSKPLSILIIHSLILTSAVPHQNYPNFLPKHICLHFLIVNHDIGLRLEMSRVKDQ